MKQKLFVCLILSVFLILSGMQVQAATENLIQNPSFEEYPSGNLVHWATETYIKDSGAVEFNMVTGNTHSGNSCISVTNIIENHSRYLQILKVKEHTRYKLSCWIYAENVGMTAKGANLSIEGRLETTPDIRGTNGKWEYVEMYASIGKGIETIKLAIGIGGYGSLNSGKACFDDVEVAEVDTIPQNAILAAIEGVEYEQGLSVEGMKKEKDFVGFEGIIWQVMLLSIYLLHICLRAYKNR